MSCCGKTRQQLAGGMTFQRVEPKAAAQSSRQFTVVFEYTGQTGLTVFGPVSGRRYRFEATGSRVTVDPRDRPGLTKVPKIRQV